MRLVLFVGLILLSLPILVALSAAKEGVGRARTGQVNNPHPGLETASAKTPEYRNVHFRNTSDDVKYVGSAACKSCHQTEYEHYFQTPHGQATRLPADRPEMKDLPPEGKTVCPDASGHCFRVFRRDDGYYMSQFDRGADGTESNVEVEKIAFALGKPLMATGYVIQRGNHLFEAPLTFFAVPGPQNVRGWVLSPGYANDSRDFNRPLIDACLSCHVGRPRAEETGINRYKSPAYEELAIGCESCHGPGALHVSERQESLKLAAGERASGELLPAHLGADTSIVNPKYLNEQLADDTCMYCHELGEARVVQPGRSLQDYRPGAPLLKTVAIFKSKLLLGWNLEEWHDEMATSKCFRLSKGAMRCSTCHDAHVTPTAQEAPEFYRSKCLTCHQSASCTLPIAKRQQTQPVDNCITCHMPKHTAPRLVKFGGQGTSHRITITADEPLPPADSARTVVNPATGLILTDSDATDRDANGDKAADAQQRLDPRLLLEAYQGIQTRYRRNDFAAQYDALLRQLSSKLPGDKGDAVVFSALANSEVAKRTDEGDRMAIHYLSEAIRLESDAPRDYMLLSELQFRAKDFDGAIATLTLALNRFPYTPAAYERLAACYLSAGQPAKAAESIRRGVEVFPADRNLLRLSQQTYP